MSIAFDVIGKPQPAGSKRAFVNPKSGRAIVTDANAKGHYGTGRNADQVKASAPPHPTTKPDATKLVRAVEDALTGVIWRDDSQVVRQWASKVYDDCEGVSVIVTELAA